VVNVAVFVLGIVSATFRELSERLGAMQGAAVLHGQLWRLITAQYLHADAWHLLFNMLTLHFLGRPLETRWTRRRFFAVYTLCGMAGNIFFTFLAFKNVLDPYRLAIGASGSVYGLMGVAAVWYPHATVYIQFLFPIKLRTAALILGGIALVRILERGDNYGGEACHLAGLLFGVWWAFRGESWWDRRPQRFKIHRRRQRSKDANVYRATTAERVYDEARIDQILKKVYDGGIHTLTESEKSVLRDATDRQRARDGFGPGT
jgi:membrane associated rhomboid family serine protease